VQNPAVSTTPPRFGPALFDFLRELRANNDREWFQRNKARYERDVKAPALLFVECALLAHIPSSLQVAGVAGHSVGEYAAAVAAGALAPGDAMRLVVERGRAMAAMREGGMSAVLGIDAGAVEELCGAVREELGECVVVANLNAPGQVVVSGTRAGLDALTERARDAGARRVVRLNVSGAFHSPLMHDAAERFAGVLDAAPIRDPSIPIVCNVDAQPVRDADGLRLRLRRQLESPVRWADCVARLVELGAARLVEVGPGSVLTGLAKRIAPEVAAVSARSAAEATQLDGSAA